MGTGEECGVGGNGGMRSWEREKKKKKHSGRVNEFKDDIEKLQKWRLALRQTADFSGWHYKRGEYEREIIREITDNISHKLDLLILDDVDTHEQLQAIAARPDWFGPGSKIIITTRDKQLLTSHEVNKTYEVKKLDVDDALQLLTWKAFKKEKAYPTYVEVLHDAVTYAFGLPLALEVIGSHLNGKSIEGWESAIKQYKRIPKKKILDILKVSFDALEEEEKFFFLDITCCFKGWRLTEVEHIIRDRYDDGMKHHIGVLVEKSLIEVSWWDGVVNMHDLSQDMAWAVSRPGYPGQLPRLWPKFI
ncbi:TMV resistance protein N-like [Glycine soja]|uniref:TMV resistance protein N-like n=1 Tax=Glycine soja TaxID=3848 RepID=UPI00103F263C|nr:TMV resistance protein N-like [Glycine soja]